MKWWMICLLGLMTGSTHAVLAFDVDQTPFKHRFSVPPDFSAGTELVISGINTAAQNVVLIIRLDDRRASSYASRVNLERVLPPGPFHLRLPLAGLKTPSGRRLQTGALIRMILFVAKGQAQLQLDAVRFAHATPLPDAARGWDLGPGGGALFPGFSRLTVDDSALGGQQLQPVERPAGDALIRDGINGIERLTLPLANGHWRISLWTRDLGEWEYLPHPLQRTIHANGRLVHSERYTPQQWIAQIYLQGRSAEAMVDGAPWELFGDRRAGLVQFEADITEQHLVLQLGGDSPAARYLAAVLAEPAPVGAAFTAVQAARAEHFNSTWRVTLPDRLPSQPLHLWAVSDFESQVWQGPVGDDRVRVLNTAPGSVVNLDFAVLSARDDSQPVVLVDPPILAGNALPLDLRFGHWRFTRPQPAATLLELHSDHLRGDLAALQLAGGIPRRLNLTIRVPEKTPPGRYRGRLQLASGAQVLSRDFELQVLPIELPPLDRPVGVYLERPPHFDWFADLAQARADNLHCDLALLKRHGLSGIAPPLTTPLAGQVDVLMDELALVQATGFQTPQLAYAPVKRLVQKLGLEAAAAQLAEVRTAIQQRGLVAPLWAIADEPGNPGNRLLDPIRLSQTLRTAAPGIRLAGQLNSPSDRRWLSAFDVVLVNAGFGVDKKIIDDIKREGVTPWLYNLPRMRLAAGFYLWRVGARGYLQWHGRMPTADPFDPTDGREADIQFLFPHALSCPAMPDIDARLLLLSEGITDLRWLLWLEQQAQHSERAHRLLQQLRTDIPDNWHEVKNLPPTAPVLWRARIEEFAKMENQS